MLPREYEELEHELRKLVEAARASNAFVFDAWGVLWASASMTFGDDQGTLYAQIVSVVDSSEPPLHRGGKLDRTFHDLGPVAYCRSFAAVYVLCVWTFPTTDENELRRAVARSLPRIEAVTVSLPPPDGSDPSSGAQRGHA